ncbi:hypothetical protein DM02DRAFT_655651 [Periconia macrospinosa]|uniref:Uncharacterized protein n=1 Tax=Periconia macrospinosa TaxID=97972 RepID=A0A2V1DSA0_9PLEO|nr:hypothetical protein DM02DRAFT_655651 [Periconia macrospinosa]
MDITTPLKHTPLNSSFPVFLPYNKSLWLPVDQFEQYISLIIQHAFPYLYVARDESLHHDIDNDEMVTEVTQSRNPLAGLFFEIKSAPPISDLKKLLKNAWEESPITTLKIIFNTRSIHLGNADKVPSYRAFGWLAEHHPITFLRNIQWLVRPVINNPDDNNQFGISHGCWKDLLNILRLATYDELKIDGDFSCVIDAERKNNPKAKRERIWKKQEAKKIRQMKIREHHKCVVEKLEIDLFYQALHITVARLFAEQLKADILLYSSRNKQDSKKISLAAKWTPSHSESMDKHTFILSAIAEILYPNPEKICPNPENRELYLRTARELLRQEYVSPLRKALALVERDITAETFSNIDYERVPSIAMEIYTPLFAKKDAAGFEAHFIKQFERKLKLQDRNMTPPTLIQKALYLARYLVADDNLLLERSLEGVKFKVKNHVIRQTISKQWNELVQRTRNSRLFESSIAVSDLSFEAQSPRLEDGLSPQDAIVAFSLLIAEVAAQPFGSGFIKLDSSGKYVAVGGPQDQRDIVQKVKLPIMSIEDWSSGIVPAFEDIILPMAIHYNINPKDMIKKVFVFTIRPFGGTRQDRGQQWDTSYDRIRMKFSHAGYDVPELIFWSFSGSAPTKPIRIEYLNTTLVSGYSHQMAQSFVDTGDFEDFEENIEERDSMSGVLRSRGKINAMAIVDKATSHEAYSMLELVD